MNELLVIKEVADILRMTPRTVRHLVDSGQIPVVRVGRSLRIRRADLEKILVPGKQVRK